VALDSIRMCGVLTHIDPAIPLSMQRVDDLLHHSANSFDIDFDPVSMLKVTDALVIRPAGNDVAGVQCHHRSRERDQLRDAVLHIVRIVVVAQLSITPESDMKVVGI
jgi:hypothetical protein